jgi:hypothetical protein
MRMNQVPSVAWKDECSYSMDELEAHLENEAAFLFRDSGFSSDELDNVVAFKEYYLSQTGDVGCVIRLTVDIETGSTGAGQWRVKKSSVYECGRCLKFQRECKGGGIPSSVKDRNRVLLHAVKCPGDGEARRQRRKLAHTVEAVAEDSEDLHSENSDSDSDFEPEGDGDVVEPPEQHVEEDPIAVATTYVSVRTSFFICGIHLTFPCRLIVVGMECWIVGQPFPHFFSSIM